MPDAADVDPVETLAGEAISGTLTTVAMDVLAAATAAGGFPATADKLPLAIMAFPAAVRAALSKPKASVKFTVAATAGSMDIITAETTSMVFNTSWAAVLVAAVTAAASKEAASAAVTEASKGNSSSTLVLYLYALDPEMASCLVHAVWVVMPVEASFLMQCPR